MTRNRRRLSGLPCSLFPGLFLGLLLALAAAVAPLATAGPAAPAPGGTPADTTGSVLAGALAPLAFLVGNWGGPGTGAIGVSSGDCSFEPAIEGHALLRRSVNISANGRHEDITLIYETPAGVRAVYTDTEGHSINYTVTTTEKPATAVFLSDEVPGGPRFRLTNELLADGSLHTVFAMILPGSTEFKTYVEGTVTRR